MSRTERDLSDLYQRPLDDEATQRLLSGIPTLARDAHRGRTPGPILWVTTALVVVGLIVAVAAVHSNVRRAPAAATPTYAGPSRPGTSPPSDLRGPMIEPSGHPTVLDRLGGARSGYSIQLRDATNGRLVSRVYRGAPGAEVSASRDSAGAIFIATSTECNSTVTRLDPETSSTTVVGSVPESMAGISISPDGSRLAYLTYPTCQPPRTCPGLCYGVIQYLPNVLAVLDLRTGSTVRTETNSPGNPFFGFSWSPDGRQIVAGYNDSTLLVMDADHPDFHQAARVPSPRGCSYFAPTWTAKGIFAAEGCGSEPILSPVRIARFDSTGAVDASWPLPECIDGLDVVSDPAGVDVIVQADIGYGDGSCGQDWRTQLLTPVGAHLRVVFDRANHAGGGNPLHLLDR